MGNLRRGGVVLEPLPAFLCADRRRYGSQWRTVSVTNFFGLYSRFLRRAKYPLAVVDYLLANLEGTIGMGYDIGCKFKATVAKSSLQPVAATRYKSLVGAFHGHAHNRRCQLDFLATYVRGLGLEYLEQCEQFFSESNELASSVRYATTFHRHQAITSYLQHKDRVDTYANLSTILCSSYKRALAVLDMEPELVRLMRDFNMADRTEFEEWLREEKEYLQGLSRQPPEETLQMEYYKKLLKLKGYQCVIITFFCYIFSPSS